MGKEVPESSQSFYELKAITDAYYSEKLEGRLAFRRLYGLLGKYNIKLRNKDGCNPKMTFSCPTTGNDKLVLGIRYVKNSGQYREDHFIFQRGENIYRCKGKEIDKLLPEYRGMHEHQPEEAS